MVGLISGLTLLLNASLQFLLGYFYGSSTELQEYLLCQLVPLLLVAVVAEMIQIGFLKNYLNAATFEERSYVLMATFRQMLIVYVFGILVQLTVFVLGKIPLTFAGVVYSIIFFLAAFFSYVATVFIAMLQADGNINKPAIVHLLPPIVALLAFVGFKDLVAVAVSYMVSALLQAMVLYSILSQYNIKIAFTQSNFFDRTAWSGLATNTLMLSVASSAIVIYSTFDKYIHHDSILEYTYAWTILLAGTTVVFKSDYLHVAVVTAGVSSREAFGYIMQSLRKKAGVLIVLYGVSLSILLIAATSLEDSIWLNTVHLLFYFAPIAPLIYLVSMLNREILRRDGLRYAIYILFTAIALNLVVANQFDSDWRNFSTLLSLILLFELERRWLKCGKNS